jgi:hypothetical protein
LASLGILVADLARALGVPAATVGAYAKALREAKLIRSSGRGTSAALMQIEDGAVLLTAMLASPSIAEAPVRAKQALKLPFMGSVAAPIGGGESANPKRVLGSTITSPLDVDPPHTLENAIHMLLSTAMLNVPVGAGASRVELNSFSDFWNGESAQITFGFPLPVAIVDTRISKTDVRRHVFGGRSKFEANAKWPGFDLLDWEAKQTGQEFTQARRIGAKAIMATAASLMKPIKTTRVRR